MPPTKVNLVTMTQKDVEDELTAAWWAGHWRGVSHAFVSIALGAALATVFRRPR